MILKWTLNERDRLCGVETSVLVLGSLESCCVHGNEPAVFTKQINEESFVLFVTYNQNDEIEENEMGGACSTNWGKRNTYRLLVRKREGKRPLERPRHRRVGGGLV
jgi:hypothetical protein